jgi:hypothetical protein
MEVNGIAETFTMAEAAGHGFHFLTLGVDVFSYAVVGFQNNRIDYAVGMAAYRFGDFDHGLEL